MLFPTQFLEAIPVGVNLEPVRWKFALMLLGENAERVKSLEIYEAVKTQVLEAIEQVAALHLAAIETGEWNDSAAESAESAAWSAAWSAWSAAWSAQSAAWSAQSAAESAESAAWSAADSAAYGRYADALLEMLRAAK
jgi:cellobiose phosphorylase